MQRGTKSLLFGVHQFIWHPFTVFCAWVMLYKRMPNIKEAICIFIHDWGYWGKPDMDGKEGEQHPIWAADVAHRFLDTSYREPIHGFSMDGNFEISGRLVKDTKYRDLCLYHSRHFARHTGHNVSDLCHADKLSILFEPWWWYLPRAWASGELAEYRKVAANAGFVSLQVSHRQWFAWVKDRLLTLARERRGDAVPYVNPAGEDHESTKNTCA